MEEDLEEFLHSRSVPDVNILRMKRDKIDKAVLSVMTDEQIARYIPSYGDRLAVVSFCNQKCRNTDKEGLLQRLREKIGQRKMKSKGGHTSRQQEGMARQGNKGGEKSNRKIEIGWLHFAKDGYQQVRTRNGGGTRHETVEKTATVAQILDMGKGLFFPNGLSPKGRVEDMDFDVCDFKRNTVPLNHTVGQLYQDTKLKLLRFYVCTKDRDADNSSSASDECSEGSSSEGEIHHDSNEANGSMAEGGSHTEEDLLTDQPEQCEENLNTRGQRQDTNSSHPHASYSSDSEIIDVEVASAAPTNQPTGREHIIYAISDHSDSDTIEWQPGDELGRAAEDDGTVVVNVKDDHVPQLEQGLNLPPQHLSTHQSTEPGSSEHPRTIRRASVHRIKVFEDLVSVFKDSSVLDVSLKMDFINEKAIDDAGVSREVYTAFWEQFLQQCDGESERVPRLRPDYCQGEWQAVGRVWVKGLLDLGVMPVMLSKAFILACIHGMDSVDLDLLVMSFLNYLPPVERAAVERALKGTMEDDDEEDLLDLFSRMGSHSLPPKGHIRAAIESMAHKAILQEPKFVRDSFSTVMMAVQQNLPDKESVLALYASKKATGKRVVQLLETTNVFLSQREQTVFSYLQRYVKNADQTQVEKFLRFCTGSSVICVEKVMVSFNVETGLGRRPIGHTCGATLEVPCTYSSFPEFRTEFDNILSSNCFEMDII